MGLPSTQAKLVMKVVLNDGNLPTADGYTCTPTDSEMIKKIIGEEGDGEDEEEDDEEDEDDEDRKLYSATYCRNACKGYVSGSCHVTGCAGFRRRKNRLLRISTHRKLDEDMAICADGLIKLNRELDSVIPKLSANCRPLVETMRNVTCFDDVRYAAINSFTLWDAITDSEVQTNLQNNTSICYTNSTWNIEAVANACVEKVNVKISGRISTSRDIRTTAPYFVFPNNGETDVLGRKFPVGTYTVSTKLEGSLTPMTRVTFVVKNCPQ